MHIITYEAMVNDPLAAACGLAAHRNVELIEEQMNKVVTCIGKNVDPYLYIAKINHQIGLSRTNMDLSSTTLQ